MRNRHCLGILVLVAALASCQPSAEPSVQWQTLKTGTDSNLRGLHVLRSGALWATGSKGTVVRSTDGGATFEVHTVHGEEKSELRDIHAFDANHAIFIVCQPARIYRTRNGGRSFQKVYDAENETAFLDAIAFFDDKRGLAFGDALGDRFQLLRTTDGGDTWKQVADEGLPKALPGEGGFAASGTCLTVSVNGHAWIGTGIAVARVFRSEDHGATWTVGATPLPYGPSAGVFSVAFRNDGHGVVVGGDYKQTAVTTNNAATSKDGGETWQPVMGTPPGGFRSCVVAVPTTKSKPDSSATWFAVGETGADRSLDDGHSWSKVGDRGYHVVKFQNGNTGFAAGAKGRMARVKLR